MNSRSIRQLRSFTAAWLAVWCLASASLAQTTAFSYQGKLTEAGNPANGAYDLQFRLLDALLGGNQVGAPVVREDVTVSNGIFTVTLDFGAAAFPGANRWLEIGVRPGASTGAFTVLSPLQPITSTPYALQSLNAVTAINAVNFSGTLAGAVTGTQTATALANNAVTTAKLADGSVTDAKIAAVAGGKLSGSITIATIPGANVTGAVANATNATTATTAVNFSGALGGDVTGNQTATTVARLRNVSLPAPVLADHGKVLKYKNNGVDPISFEWATDNASAGGVTSVTASGPLASSGGATPNISLTGVVAAANGGTGLSAVGAAGNLLRSNGAAWTSAALQAADVPDLGASYLKNTTTQQASSNFNVSGNGTAGGTLTGNIVNATTRYDIGGSRVLSTAGTRNVFAGIGAGQANTLGTDNAFFGYNAGLNNTGNATSGGRFNSFFGSNAGQLLTQGRSNSFFGSNAGGASTASNNNSFFGAGVGSNNTGDNNAFFGVTAGSGNVGDDNSFFGLGAGSINKGNRNSFFGRSAGRQELFGDPTLTATGEDNAFFGSYAGFRNLASGNSFFGSLAGNVNTIGFSNSFFGLNAGNTNTTGCCNAFFGKDAGLSNTDGFDNAFFGERAGRSNTTGRNNTMIGNNANVGSGNLYNATAIGADAFVEADNTLVLGSTGTNVVIGATGSGVNHANSRAARLNVFGGEPWTTAGWKSAVKIENAAAIGWDSVSGSFGIGRSTGGLYFFRTASYIGTPSLPALYDMIINDAGNVGIGLTDGSVPQRLLHVNGRARIGSIPLEASVAGVCFNAIGDLLNCGASSLRLKQNVRPYRHGLDLVLRLRPISYEWKESGRADFGLGAEDVARVAPALAFTNEKGEVEGVKYEKLNLLLINAVQEQQTQIETLRAANAALQARLAALEQMLRQLMEQTQKATQPKRP